MVCAVGLCTSINRWCVRVSKCSRLSLFTCGERKTQKMRRFVGNGTGPEMRASVDLAASMILSHALCMWFVSNERRRMRILDACTAACAKGGKTNRAQSVSVSSCPVTPRARVARGFPGRRARPPRRAPRAIERKNNTHRARRGVSPPPARRARDASTSRAPSPPSRPGSRRMNEFARARTACAVVARGLVCERMGNNFFTSVLPFAMRVVVVVVVVASRTRAVSRRHSRVSRARARGRAHRRARSRRSRAERGGGLRGKHGRRRGHLGVRSTRARRRVRGRARGTAPGGGGRVEWRLARWCGMVWSMSHDPS